MAPAKNKFTVFEHDALYVNKGEQRLSQGQLMALQLFYREKDFPYYSLVHNGVRFCEYVGVICTGRLTIEVLPKADKDGDELTWRRILIDMMRSTGLLSPDAPSFSDLKLKSSTLLDLYLELFLSELEMLVRQGLVKKYRSKESNGYALKGKLLIGKHALHNQVHQERFYVKESNYQKQHLLHEILYKAIKTVMLARSESPLAARYKKILLEFPEQADIKASEQTFSRIHYDRKSQGYRKAVDIAKLILLNYHPDLSAGSSNVLAIMFDMNQLWERFVHKGLQRFSPGCTVAGQSAKDFWTSSKNRTKKLQPDIVIRRGDQILAVLDTKWKNIKNHQPGDDDLRQMYAYSRYHENAASFLVYPGPQTEITHGKYHKNGYENTQATGSIIILKVDSGKQKGQFLLSREIFSLIGQ